MNKSFKIALMLGGLSAIPPISTDIYISGFPMIADSFQVTPTQVQLSLTASLMGIAAGQIFIGPLSDIYGRRKPLLISLFLFIIASFLCTVVDDITSFILLRFLQGVAGSGGVVLSRTIAYDKYQGQTLTEFIALIMIITGIAPILAPVLGGQLITYFGWQSVFLFVTLCGILLFLGTIFLLSESLPKEKRTGSGFKAVLSSFLVLFKNKAYTASMLVHCFILGGLFAYISASPFILQVIYGLSPVEFSMCFALNGIGMMLAAKFASSMIIRFNEIKQLKFTIMVYTLAGLLLLGIHFTGITGPLWPIISLFIFASCIGPGECNSFSVAMQSITGNAGSASGMIGIGSFMFGALMTPLVSLGGEPSLLPLGIIIIITGVLSMFLMKWIKFSADRS